MKEATEERFWKKVDKTGECWLWTAVCNSDHYGRFWHGGKMVLAHRVSYAWANGEIPEGMYVDHRCHTRNCVRPDHLRLATHAQNLQNRRGADSDSATGVRGVHWDKRDQKFVAKVGLRGKKYLAGYFDTLEEAEAAVTAKRRELFTHDDHADWATTTEGVPHPGASML